MGPPTPTPQRSKVPILTRDTGSKLVGELGEKIIVGTVFGRPKDDDGASVVHWGQRVWLRQPAKQAGREVEAGAEAHLPSASPSHSSEPSLLDLVGDGASARGSARQVTLETVSPALPKGNSTVGSSHNFPINPTYPVIQSWSPSPRRKSNSHGRLGI